MAGHGGDPLATRAGQGPSGQDRRSRGPTEAAEEQLSIAGSGARPDKRPLPLRPEALIVVQLSAEVPGQGPHGIQLKVRQLRWRGVEPGLQVPGRLLKPLKVRPRGAVLDLVGDHGTYPSTARACLQRPHSWAAKPLNDSHWFGYEYDVELLVIATQVASSIRS